MGILQIQRASRAGAHLLISLFGMSESGKTMTALKLGRGLAGPNGMLGFLDTEAGRGRLYSDAIFGGYDIGELSPPFHPARYAEAIREFEAAGYAVLIIDSFSHVWAGAGGVLDMADANGKQGLLKWQAPKNAYRGVMNALLSTRMHVILCSRGKQPTIEGLDAAGKKTLTKGETVEVQDKLLRYEMTVVLEMQQRGQYVVKKCPDALLPIFDGNALLNEQAGERLAAWVAGGSAINQAFEALKRRADDAADEGTEAFRSFYKELTPDQRALIIDMRDDYASRAKAADERIAAERAGDPDDQPTAPTLDQHIAALSAAIAEAATHGPVAERSLAAILAAPRWPATLAALKAAGRDADAHGLIDHHAAAVTAARAQMQGAA